MSEMDVQRILAPTDFSDCSRAALEWAARLARRFGAGVDVLHAWRPPSHDWTPYAPAIDYHHLELFERTEAGSAMKRLLADLEREDVPANGRLVSGDPLKTILRFAASGEYQLIVMGTHGRTGMSHLLSGSIAEAVVRRSPCPVLTVRSHEHALLTDAVPMSRVEVIR
jgi:nucleotide-binding universal stress UspA family protein